MRNIVQILGICKVLFSNFELSLAFKFSSFGVFQVFLRVDPAVSLDEYVQTSLDLKSELEDLIVLQNSLGIKNDVDGPLEFCEDFKMFQGIHVNTDS